MNGVSETIVAGTDDATWSSRTTASDPAADGSVTGKIERRSDSASLLSVETTTDDDLLHTTGFGDWWTRHEEGAGSTDTLTVTSAAGSEADLTYAVDADGKTTLVGSATAYAAAGLATGSARSARLRSTGRTRAGEQGQYVADTDYAADSFVQATSTDGAGATSAATFAADGSALLIAAETTTGGTSFFLRDGGAGGTIATDAPAEPPPPPPPGSVTAQQIGGDGSYESTYWRRDFSRHDVNRRGTSGYQSLGTLRVETPAPADADGDGEPDPADPTVTLRYDASGSFRDDGDYATENRTHRIKTADYTHGGITLEEGSGREVSGGANDDEYLDRRTADGSDWAEGPGPRGRS